MATTVAVGIASACKPNVPTWYASSWQLSDPDDDEAPTTAPVISGRVRPPTALEGCGEADLSSDPGDCSTLGAATIVIEEAAQDDRTDAATMAYRVEILDGRKLFDEGRPLLTENDSASSSDQRVLWVHVGRNDLYTRLRVIPVDAGGNEGPPSNEIELEWTEEGCVVVRRQKFGGWTLAFVVGMACIAPLRRRRRANNPSRSAGDLHRPR